MNPQEDPRVLIGALGALENQAAIWLRNEPLPVTQTYLCSVLHKSDKTMASALNNLEIYQICTHSSEGWSITANIVQLGLSLPEWLQNEDGPAEPVENPVDKGRNFSDSNSLTTSSTSSIKLTNKKLEKNLLLAGMKQKIKPEPELETKPERKPEPVSEPNSKSQEMIQECHQAAIRSGIGEPKATDVAKLPNSTPEMIEQYVEAALQEGQTIGLAIHRLENFNPANKTQKRVSKNKKSRGYEDRQRYVNGKYSEYINH